LMRYARRKPRAALAALTVLTALVAVISLSTLAAGSASAAQDITLTLSPSSGSNYSTDSATLSWTVLSACEGQEVDAFIYAGTGTWNAAAINEAEGNSGGQLTYFNFSSIASATSTTGSASWPNVSKGYIPFGEQTTEKYTTTAQLVSALGNGLYTIAMACVDPSKNYAPVLDSSGNPIAGTMIVQIGASGDSWAVSQAVGTQIALTGSGTAGTSKTAGTVSLTAAVTAGNGTVPTGAVNFYASGSAAGTPLNSTPVTVGSNGKATYSGQSGYTGGQGAQEYTAQFVPANPALYDASSVSSGNIDLIAETVTITVTAQQGTKSPTALDVTATATGSPTSIPTLVAETPGIGVAFLVDGKSVLLRNSPPAPFPFSKSGVATATLNGLKLGTHQISAQLAIYGTTQDGANGYAVTANTAKPQLSGYASATAVSVAQTTQGLQVTATVTGKTTAGQAVSLVPAGTVTVKDGTAALGSAKLSGKAGSGVATGTVVGYSLPKGVDVFTATFAPSNADFTGSTGTTKVTAPTAVTWVRPGSPVIVGKAAVGDTLTVKPGTWSPAGVHLAYQWYANGSTISGATRSTLALGTAQYGKTIKVELTGSGAGDRPASAFSSSTGKVGKGTLKSSRPKITGTAKVGGTLKVSVGSWTPATRFSYQWYANGKAIGGAKGSSLKLGASLRGKRIEVAVTGAKTDYNSVTVKSAETGSVAK
jgi:hypothetical protein